MGANNPSLSPVAVIMAGGSGTRFWPLSQKNLPKQYLKLTGQKTLIEQTVDRITPLCGEDHIYISSGESQVQLLKQFVPQIERLILEPAAKNTAACLMLSVAHLLQRGYPLDTPLMVFPSDHAIGNEKAFETVVRKAVAFAQTREALVTIGIQPSSPHTGYGYIERSDSEVAPDFFKVKRFTEKPNLERATEFFSHPNYYWNGGIFIWTLRSIRKAFETYLEPFWTQIHQASTPQELSAIFSTLPSLPIDTAVLEKSPNVFVIPAHGLEWSDLGSWKALYEFHSSDPTQNISLNATTETLDAKGCVIYSSSNLKVGLIGVENLVIVEHEGFLLIADKDQDQRVKDLSQKFRP